MSEPHPAPQAETEVEAPADAPIAEDTITDELLVEEVSIDGMCGVY